MRASCVISVVLLTAFCAAGLHAQRSFGEHNSAMASLQPAFITPLVAPDPRLLQYARLSVSHEYTAAGAETVNYGNGRGAGIIAGNRFEFDFVPPPYIQHNSTADDGFGDTSVLAKFRIASGDAESGNFDIAAVLSHCFATGSYKNGAATDSYSPAITAGFAFRRRFDLIYVARRHAAYRQNLHPGKVDHLELPWRRHTPLPMSGSRWRTTQPSISQAATTARCRTLSLLARST